MMEDNNLSKESEVSHDGATELFLSIEEMEWRDAFDIIALEPEQTRIWVNNSSGSVKTIASWRRLPIHEACIRRAPAWLISELLSAFPQSSSLSTNHGELPLHLAVDKACAPEVVNLIIVANWNAIVARDHAGRTPLDIIDHDELLEIDSNKVIFESLKRCNETYEAIQKSLRDEKTALVRKQKAQSAVVSKRHLEEVKKHQTINAKLQNETEQLKKEIESAKEQTQKQDDEIQKHNHIEKEYVKTIIELQDKGEVQRLELEKERAQIKDLLCKLEEKEEELRRKNSKINALSNDLKNVVVSNETEILESLIETENSMRTMVSAQISLQKLLNSKSQGLKSILTQRGIDIPNVHKQEIEEEKSMGEEDHIEDAAASAAMMAAATAALKAMA